ncbi:EamA family transporter [Candidatus Woesebacteria bacterium]|nr:EamA family transporter [Candidatus Woesebacteria bacterium]
MKNKTSVGPFLIMAASSLWAIDALFRTQLTFSIAPASIIFIEHLIGFIILSPVFVKHVQEIKKFTAHTWVVLLAMTIVSSVAGTLMFTQALSMSFAEQDFVTPILLQKLQPVFVVGLSALFLKERIDMKFFVLSVLALIGSYMISFGTTIVPFTLQNKEIVFLLALGAAVAWGSGTILSKTLLEKVSFPFATALRFLCAIPVAFVASYLFHQTVTLDQLGFQELWRFIVIAGITGGAGALFLYYKGLQKTQAKVSTFAELMFPVVSIFIAVTPLNPYGAPQMLSVENMVGIVLLIGSILLISGENRKGTI